MIRFSLTFVWLIFHVMYTPQNPPFDVFVRGPNNTVASFTGVALNILQWIATKYNFK
jgi:hypothetical protein